MINPSCELGSCALLRSCQAVASYSAAKLSVKFDTHWSLKLDFPIEATVNQQNLNKKIRDYMPSKIAAVSHGSHLKTPRPRGGAKVTASARSPRNAYPNLPSQFTTYMKNEKWNRSESAEKPRAKYIIIDICPTKRTYGIYVFKTHDLLGCVQQKVVWAAHSLSHSPV